MVATRRSRYFRDEHFGAICAPREGLLQKLMNEWQANGEPCLVAAELDLGGARAPLLAEVERNELKNIAAHGAQRRPGRRRLLRLLAHPRPARPARARAINLGILNSAD